MRRTRLAVLLDRQVKAFETTLRPSTMRGYRGTMRHFLEYLVSAFPDVHEASQLRRDPHILGWLHTLWSHQPPFSASLRIQRVLHLRSVLEALSTDHPEISDGLLRKGDVPRKDHYLPRPLSIEDDQNLQHQWQRSQDWQAAALLAMRWSGVRIGELADLSEDCLRQLGPQQWALHVPLGKLHSERWVPVDESLREIIRHLRFVRALPDVALGRAGAGEPFLLPRPHGRSALFSELRRYLKQSAQAVGITSRVVPHQLRHTYATEMLRSGVSFPAVMKLLGHTSPEMTLRYVEISQADLQREYANACAKPRHLVPPLFTPFVSPARTDLTSVLQCIETAHRMLETIRREGSDPPGQRRLARIGNQLSKITAKLRQTSPAK